MLKKFKFSLRSKIILFFFFTVFLFLTTKVLIYQNIKKNLEEDLKGRLRNIAYLTSLSIDSSIFKRLLLKTDDTLNPSQVKGIELSREFGEISAVINKIKKSETNLIRYIYTLSPTQDKKTAKFIVDADVLPWRRGQIKDEETISHFNLKYDISDFPVMQEAFKTGKVLVEKDLSYDEDYKLWSLSGYAPILEDGKTVLGIVGVDISAQKMKDYLSNFLNYFYITFLLSVIIIGFIFFTATRFITKPIKKLINVIREMKKGDYQIRADIKTKDEIGELAISFNKMSDAIEKKNKQIQEYNEQLEEMVEKRTEELNKVNFELKKKNEGIVKELKLAQRVQMKLVPNEKDFPQFKQVKLGSEYSSMDKIGGDMFDIIKIKENLYGFLMADVSGHGIPAALISTMIKASFHSHSIDNENPADTCFKVNQSMCNFIGDTDYYFTAYYGILNLETGNFCFTNAGHQPGLLYRKKAKNIEKLRANCSFIGIIDGISYNSSSVTLEKGDRLLLFTDGITEARNSKEEFYGNERLAKYFINHSHLSPKKFVEGLIKDVNGFCDNFPVTDDRAILFLEFIEPIKSDQSIEEAIQFEARKIT